LLLLIDNYDSFTYNLVQYFGELGADVHVHRNDVLTLEQIAAWGPEQIVISPGPCTPSEAGISVPLIARFAGRIPILGVCLGHQAIGQAFGWPQTSPVPRGPNIHLCVPATRKSQPSSLTRKSSTPKAWTPSTQKMIRSRSSLERLMDWIARAMS